MELAPLSGSEPEYNPDLWNIRPEIRGSHNCYAYAMQYISPDATEQCAEKRRNGKTPTERKCSTPQPGHASGHIRMKYTPIKKCHDITARTIDDNMGIHPITFEQKCPIGTSKIALVVDEAHDYHYYRQDSNGYWSHKPGRNNVTNLDASGQLITDPRFASRDYTRDGASDLNYKDFCGFFCVPRGHQMNLVAGAKKTRKTRRGRRHLSRKNS